MGFKWGVESARELTRDIGRAADIEIFCCLLGMMFCSAILAPLTLGAGLARGEAVDSGVFRAGIGDGLITGTIASLLWRAAMLIAIDLGVEVIRYLMPLASLGWLLALGLIGDVDLRLLGRGADDLRQGGMGWGMKGRKA